MPTPEDESASESRSAVRSNILFVFAVAIALAIAWRIRDTLILIYVSALRGGAHPCRAGHHGFRDARWTAHLPRCGDRVAPLLCLDWRLSSLWGSRRSSMIFTSLRRTCRSGCQESSLVSSASLSQTAWALTRSRPKPKLGVIQRGRIPGRINSEMDGWHLQPPHRPDSVRLFHAGRRIRLRLAAVAVSCVQAQTA